MGAEDEPLLTQENESLYATERPTRDVAWALAYLGYTASVFAVGAYSFAHYDPTALQGLSTDYLAVRMPPI
jgi:hypothetical protein